MYCMLTHLKQLVRLRLHVLHRHIIRWTRPACTSLLLEVVGDLARESPNSLRKMRYYASNSLF